jgi:Cation transporter/ATPase, N-terminus
VSVSQQMGGAAGARPGWHQAEASAVARELGVDPERELGVDEARRRLESHSLNRLAGGKKESGFQAFLRQYRDFMQLILLAAAAISLFVTGDVGTADVLTGLTVFNAVVGLRPGRRCPPEPATPGTARGPQRGRAARAPLPAENLSVPTSATSSTSPSTPSRRTCVTSTPSSACTAAPRRSIGPASWDSSRRPSRRRQGSLVHTIRVVSAHPTRLDIPCHGRVGCAARYKIRVRGILSETLLGAFPGLHAQARGSRWCWLDRCLIRRRSMGCWPGSRPSGSSCWRSAGWAPEPRPRIDRAV